MSEKSRNPSFATEHLPQEFSKYFHEDTAKIHREKLSACRENASIIIEITRDIHTGVLDLGDDCFILNPLDARNMMEGVNYETMSEDVLDNILKSDYKVVSYKHDQEQFLNLWKVAFFNKVRYLRSIFKNVILLELYFTSRLVNGEHYWEIVPVTHDANVILEKMYAFARRCDVQFVTLDRELFQTGWDVPWGGPLPTHYAQETLCLLAQGVRDIVLPDHPGGPDLLRRQAFRRAGQYELTRTELERATQDIRVAREETSAAEGRVAEAARLIHDLREEVRVARERAAKAAQDAFVARQSVETARAAAAQAVADRLRLSDALEAAQQELATAQSVANDLRSQPPGPPAPSRALAIPPPRRKTWKRVRAWVRNRLPKRAPSR